MAALARRRVKVAPAKVGPDFIDPGYHQLATGKPGRNLDEWISGTQAILPLAAAAANCSDVLVVEGVMGLFDGASVDGPDASTWSVANLIAAPIVLVIDASSVGRSIAALVEGFLHHRPRKVETHYPGVLSSSDKLIRGLILNKVGSDHHEYLLRDALENVGIPVLGVLRRNPYFEWRDRHLGLIPVIERRAEIATSIEHLASAIDSSVDLQAIMDIASDAPTINTDPMPPAQPSGHCVVAVASGKAFSFAYEDNLERLRQAGAELAFFDPMIDEFLPQNSTGLYAGGGFPEAYLANLSGNETLRKDVRTRTAAGMVTWAECGGMAWLSDSLDGNSMCGVLRCDVKMGTNLSMGYRRALALEDSPIASKGSVLRGHEFHYSKSAPGGNALEVTGRQGKHLDGFASPTLMATYLHLHLGSDPSPAERFVHAACRARSDCNE